VGCTKFKSCVEERTKGKKENAKRERDKNRH
jgi:hypothetical protein